MTDAEKILLDKVMGEIVEKLGLVHAELAQEIDDKAAELRALVSRRVEILSETARLTTIDALREALAQDNSSKTPAQTV